MVWRHGCLVIGQIIRNGDMLYLKHHGFQITHYVGWLGPNTTDGTRINEQGLRPFDIVYLTYFRLMVMSAADHIPITGSGHGAGIVWKVDHEYPSPVKFYTGILAVIMNQVTLIVAESGHTIQVTGVIAVNNMYRQAIGLRIRRVVGATTSPQCKTASAPFCLPSLTAAASKKRLS